MKEFPAKELFEAHLRSTHGELLESADLSSLMNTLSALSLPRSKAQQVCPLCQTPYHDLQELKGHLGNHLEQFALTAIYIKDSDDEGSEAGVGNDDEVQEHPVLDRFVDELGLDGHNLNSSIETLRQHQTQWATFNLGKHQSEVGRSEGSDSSENEDETKPTKAEERANRVKSFLNKQSSPSKHSRSGSPVQVVRSNLPPRNLDFVGRQVDLDRVHKVLSTPGQICVLSGRGGVGKTATAVEYCYRFEQKYPSIFWVEAETAGGCADRYTLIACYVCQGDSSKHGQSVLANQVREYLSKTETRWLLVFDNVEDWGNVSQYLPRNMARTQGSVLITAREMGHWHRTSKIYTEVALAALTVEDSTRLLLRSIQSESRPELLDSDLHAHPEFGRATEASRLVGQLPLAISMIAGYVKVSKSTLKEFLETWEEQEARHESEKTKNEAVEHGAIDSSIDSLWDIGIGELMMKARNVLDILSFLDPETIQKDLLVGDHSEKFLEFLNSRERIKYVKRFWTCTYNS
jgi:hypothetical protein